MSIDSIGSITSLSYDKYFRVSKTGEDIYRRTMILEMHRKYHTHSLQWKTSHVFFCFLDICVKKSDQNLRPKEMLIELVRLWATSTRIMIKDSYYSAQSCTNIGIRYRLVQPAIMLQNLVLARMKRFDTQKNYKYWPWKINIFASIFQGKFGNNGYGK